MNTYTFTRDELEAFLSKSITFYAGNAYMELTPAAREDRQATINYMMATLDDAKRLENSLPLVDEDVDVGEFDYDGWYPEHVLEVDDLEFDDRIPFQGEPTPYNDDDNISPAAIGLGPVA